VMAGVYLGTVALSGFFLGSLVDRFRKKTAMLISSICSLCLYLLAFVIYTSTPEAVFADPSAIPLWGFILLTLIGAIAGNIRPIALSVLVTILIPEDTRDKANGMVGAANGVSFPVAAIFSGFLIGFLGVLWVLVFALALTLLVIIHPWFVPIPE